MDQVEEKKQQTQDQNIKLDFTLAINEKQFDEKFLYTINYRQLKEPILTKNDIPFNDLLIKEDCYLVMKLRLLPLQQKDYSKLDTDFKQICKSLHLILTSFVRKIRDMCKPLTFSYKIPIQSDYAYIGVRFSKPDHHQDFLDSISSIYSAFDKSNETGRFKGTISSDLSFANLVEDKLVQTKQIDKLFYGSWLTKIDLSFSKQAMELANLCSKYLTFNTCKKQKKVEKYMKLFRIMKQGKIQLSLDAPFNKYIEKNSFSSQKSFIKKKKPPFKIPIFRKAIEFGNKFLDNFLIIEFICPQFEVIQEIKYTGNICDILPALLDA